MSLFKKTCSLLLIALLLAGSLTAQAADSDAGHVVRVGFPVQSGTSYIDEHGNYAGYLVDYLHQLTMFTHWDIEYVQVEGDLNTQLETLMDMLQRGEIDMLGTMNRDARLEELFLYPNYSYGTRYTTLAVLQEDPSWIEEDFSDWDGIRVAAYAGNREQISQFDYYATINDFSYQLTAYDSYDQMIQAVRTGQADALIQSDISLTEELRVVGRFSPTP